MKPKYIFLFAIVLAAAGCQNNAGVQQKNQSKVSQSNINQTSTAATSSPEQNQPTNNSQPTAAAADPLAGLGSNKYADGILPLGDYKYTTSGPKKGYVYLCRVQSGGGGAQTNGSWISGSSWNENQKINVQGNVSWPSASVSIKISGSNRIITTNDLPPDHTTGIYPVQSSDPAYQVDRNPNTITAQNFTFTLPANPVQSSSPSCMGGEVGVMTDGIVLFNAFDAEGRDAAAHEVQDHCQAHPQESGIYHYHSLSSCIPNATVENVIGFAFDGFPITGPNLSNGKYLTTADLDECHGLSSEIILNGKKITMYHYVMTQDFPYSVSCFRGKNTLTGPLGGSGQQSQTQQPPSGGQSGPTPPAEAISACSGKTQGTSCSFSTPQGTVSGSCMVPPGQTSLACVPQ